MGIAANAVADLAGPPPPRAATNAPDASSEASSFQGHVREADRMAPREERPQPNDARPPTRQSNTQSGAQSSAQPNDRSEKTTTPAPGPKEEDHADTKADTAPTPIFLQLIAHAISPITAVATGQAASLQQQDNSQATPAEQAAAQATKAPLISAQAAALATPAVRTKGGASMPGANGRPLQVKTAKGATAKTEAASSATATETPEAAASASQADASVTLAASLGAQDAAASEKTAKSNAASGAVDGVQMASERAARPHPSRQEPHQAAPPTQAPPLAPKTAIAANAGEAKLGVEGKALASADALKQAAQDFASLAPKTQSSPSTPAATQPTFSAHAQLATPAAQDPARAADARTQSPPAAVQVGGEIVRRFNGGDTRFQMRLDPPDLGRVDVRLDVSRDHRVTAVISADSPQALSDLSREAPGLQRALQSAGLDLADDGLRFDLSSNGQGNAFTQAQAQQDQPGFRAANTAQADNSIAPELTARRPLSIDSWRGARVDVMA